MKVVRRGWLPSRVLGVVLIACPLANRPRELSVFAFALLVSSSRCPCSLVADGVVWLLFPSPVPESYF